MSTPELIIPFAATRFRNQYRKFGIKLDDRRRHMYVVGKTGMGKSTLLENMIIADMRAGNGIAVVDPHGDLAEKILNFVPSSRINDVIYFNPADTKFPVAFNILESVGVDYKHLVAYGLVGVFKKIWADSWGPRMEYILTNTILALLDYPGSTLLGLMRMLVDKAYRKKVVDKITDPVVKTFWTDEFANYSEKFRTEAIAPIQNKVGQFLSSSIIRNIVGQSKSTIEMRELMDNKKILIINLSKGRVGEENSALLGAMMITRLQIAAMSRVDIPEEQRSDFYLYVDEFQNFATDSFASILSEARKYRLCLIMAHQYLEQLGDVVKPAVFGNVGTMIVFRIGATDALELEPEFTPQFLAQDIVNLPKYAFCLRLMIDGIATDPFSAMGLEPASGRTDNADKVIKVSRERYAHPQADVEDKIIRWSGVEVSKPAAVDNAGSIAEDALLRPVEQDYGGQADKENTKDVVQSNVESTVSSVVLGVDPTSFIPGLQIAQPKPVFSPRVQIESKPSIAEETHEAPTISSVQEKPKVNFVKSTPSQPAPVKPVELPKQQPPVKIVVATPKQSLPPSLPNKSPSLNNSNNTKQQPVRPAVPQQQARSLQPNQPSAPSLSLSALREQNVPKVMFNKKRDQQHTAQQPSRQPMPPARSQSPMPNNRSNNNQPSKNTTTVSKPPAPAQNQIGSKINIKDLL